MTIWNHLRETFEAHKDSGRVSHKDGAYIFWTWRQSGRVTHKDRGRDGSQLHKWTLKKRRGIKNIWSTQEGGASSWTCLIALKLCIFICAFAQVVDISSGFLLGCVVYART